MLINIEYSREYIRIIFLLIALVFIFFFFFSIEVELNLEFDENGRVGQWGGSMDFRFRAFENAVKLTNKTQISLSSPLQFSYS